MRNFISWCVSIGIVASPFILIVILVLGYGYTQRYILKGNYAESGIFATNEIDLEKHKKIGRGKGLYGEYESYSRSDRQEFIKVYFK